MLLEIIKKLLLSQLPQLLVQFYDSTLKEKIDEWVKSTDNQLDDSFAKALEAFINTLR